jgi:hypothetical protein
MSFVAPRAIDSNTAFPHSRAEVKYECQLPPEYEQDQFGGPNPTISPALANHEEFLLGFVPTGDLEGDMTTFLIGTGQEQTLVLSRQHGLSLRELAASIHHNHQDELSNLNEGKPPLWSEKKQRWSPEQRAFYTHLLRLECKALDSILNQDSGSSRRSAA